MHRTMNASPRVSGLTVRHAGAGDERELARLAALDGARPPEGRLLVAEFDAHIVAALPFGSGRAIADPFERTAEAVALLELRAAQLRAGDRTARRSLVARVRSLLPKPA